MDERTAAADPVPVQSLTESQVVQRVTDAWAAGVGGWIVTVNVDILRAVTRDADLAALVSEAEIAVADGMPLVWAAALAGAPVPERVTGASLLPALAGAAAAAGRSVYLLGGEPGVPDAAAEALTARFPGLVVAGTSSPPYGFDRDEDRVVDLVREVAATDPDLVLVGLGFPKQERLISRLRPALPGAWMLGCGAGIPFAAGQFSRAPDALQRLGLEWLHRLALEPRRLARRYLADDLPFALSLLTRAAGSRLGLGRAPVIGQPASAASAPAPTTPGVVPLQRAQVSRRAPRDDEPLREAL